MDPASERCQEPIQLRKTNGGLLPESVPGTDLACREISAENAIPSEQEALVDGR